MYEVSLCSGCEDLISVAEAWSLAKESGTTGVVTKRCCLAPKLVCGVGDSLLADNELGILDSEPGSALSLQMEISTQVVSRDDSLRS